MANRLTYPATDGTVGAVRLRTRFNSRQFLIPPPSGLAVLLIPGSRAPRPRSSGPHQVTRLAFVQRVAHSLGLTKSPNLRPVSAHQITRGVQPTAGPGAAEDRHQVAPLRAGTAHGTRCGSAALRANEKIGRELAPSTGAGRSSPDSHCLRRTRRILCDREPDGSA